MGSIRARPGSQPRRDALPHQDRPLLRRTRCIRLSPTGRRCRRGGPDPVFCFAHSPLPRRTVRRGARSRSGSPRRPCGRPLPPTDGNRLRVAVSGSPGDMGRSPSAARPMKQPLPVFTPSLAPAEVLERLFVARHQLADDIVERIRSAAISKTRNHTLLIGPRGAGKTHLISLAYHRAARLRDAGEILVQLAWLPEDPWSTTSYRRLLDAIVDSIEPGLGLTDRPTSIEEIEALLAGRVAELGPLVCFIENLDQVFDDIGPHGQQRDRKSVA